MYRIGLSVIVFTLARAVVIVVVFIADQNYTLAGEKNWDIPAGAADFRLRRDLVEILANFVEFQFATDRLLGAGNPNATQ